MEYYFYFGPHRIIIIIWTKKNSDNDNSNIPFIVNQPEVQIFSPRSI